MARATPVFSRLGAVLRVGPEHFARRGAVVAATEPPRGLAPRLSDLANPGIDTSRVHPAVAVFFEDTASLELHVRSHWRFPFSIVWWLARPVMRLIGQFVLPKREARIVTRMLALDPASDGRSDVRGVIREYEDAGTSAGTSAGPVMQVVAYATWERAGTRYMSAAFPLPGGHILGILRLDAIAEDDQGRLAVALTSERSTHGDDAAIWYALGSRGTLAVRVPLGERLSLWAAEMDVAPSEIDRAPLPGATIVGRHEQRAFGIRFVTHHYLFRPLSPR